MIKCICFYGKIIVILIFSLPICSGCSTKLNYAKTANVIIGNKVEQIGEDENLKLIALGGSMSNGVEQITLRLSAYRRVNLSEARRLCVFCVEEIKNSLNSTPSLQLHLKPYPFPSSGINLNIVFLRENGDFVDYGCAYIGTGGVSNIFQLNGKLYYSSYNPRTKFLEDYYEEPYEIALAIVRGERPDTVCEPVQPNPRN